HLQMPKEYLAAGRIAYAPHNVYANFPANVEMLYLVCMVIEGDAIDAAGVCKMLNAWLAVLVVAAAWLIGRQCSPVTGLVTGIATAGAGWLTYLSGVAYVENGMLFFGMLALAALFKGRADSQRAHRWVVLSGLFVGLACGCKYTAIGLIGLPLFVVLPIVVAGPMRRRVGSIVVFLVAALAAFAPWGIKNVTMTGDPFFPLAGSIVADHPPGWGQAQSEHFAASHAPNPNERTPGRRLAMFWRRVLLDGDGGPIRQRLGWSIFALACWASLTRRRDRWVQACWVMLFVQVVVWLWGTHLYARFAVPLLIPLIGLIGNLLLETARARRAVIVLLLLGTASSLGFTARLYAQHLRPGGDWIDLEGATGLFTAGQGLGHEHLAVINGDLPDDARVLMLGDARAFYFRRQVDYCVVFNRNPLVTLLRDGADAARVVDWLVDRGYTHVLVNWSEIRRLGKSGYGFPPEIDRDLFDRLSAAGLSRTHQFRATPTSAPYAELYRVGAGRFR
ncbi:MAG: hypothetical protein IID40_04265, partial [Planctomycetes bacterium]|nr:hypothetical protein [Planctomycetota bacterium]